MSNTPPPPPAPPPWSGSGTGALTAAEHPNGTTILVLGILSLVCCGVLGPVAWVMGHKARNDMAAEPGRIWTNRGNVTAGWVLGIVSSALLVIGGLLWILLFAAVSSSG